MRARVHARPRRHRRRQDGAAAGLRRRRQRRPADLDGAPLALPAAARRSRSRGNWTTRRWSATRCTSTCRTRRNTRELALWKIRPHRAAGLVRTARARRHRAGMRRWPAPPRGDATLPDRRPARPAHAADADAVAASHDVPAPRERRQQQLRRVAAR